MNVEKKFLQSFMQTLDCCCSLYRYSAKILIWLAMLVDADSSYVQKYVKLYC